jgi:hypothetical protein
MDKIVPNELDPFGAGGMAGGKYRFEQHTVAISARSLSHPPPPTPKA